MAEHQQRSGAQHDQLMLNHVRKKQVRGDAIQRREQRDCKDAQTGAERRAPQQQLTGALCTRATQVDDTGEVQRCSEYYRCRRTE